MYYKICWSLLLVLSLITQGFTDELDDARDLANAGWAAAIDAHSNAMDELLAMNAAFGPLNSTLDDLPREETLTSSLWLSFDTAVNEADVACGLANTAEGLMNEADNCDWNSIPSLQIAINKYAEAVILLENAGAEFIRLTTVFLELQLAVDPILAQNIQNMLAQANEARIFAVNARLNMVSWEEEAAEFSEDCEAKRTAAWSYWATYNGPSATSDAILAKLQSAQTNKNYADDAYNEANTPWCNSDWFFDSATTLLNLAHNAVLPRDEFLFARDARDDFNRSKNEAVAARILYEDACIKYQAAIDDYVSALALQ